MAQNLPSQKIHTTEITAVTISQDGKFITSFSKLDEIVALWNYPTGLNTPITLELNYLKKNKKIDIKTIIDTKNKITCEFDLTMSKKLSYDNRLFVILYSSECDKPMILDEEMEYFSPDCLKDVFGRAEFLADGETLGIYNKETIHIISIKSWPWILLRRICIQNNDFQVFTLNPSTNKNYVIFRQWEPHNVFDVIDFDTGKCYLRIMPAPGETTYKISNMCISSAGDLLAFKTSLGGLHVYDLSSGLAVMSKKLIFPCDIQFVNGGKNLLIINFDKKKEHILATLYNARSGTELAHVALSQSNTKNVRIINEEQLLVVSSNLNRNILVVDEWNWVNMFRKQPIQYTDVFTSNYKDDRDLITGYKVGKYPSFSPSVKLVRDFPDANVPPGKLALDDSCSEYVISSRSLQIRFASGVKLFCIDEQNIILVSSRMIILFCAIDNDMRKLVWRPPHYLLDINKFSYQCINDFSHKRILWIDIICGNSMKNYYTVIPLDVAISGHDLPDEWMQHSCECQGPIEFLNLLSIKLYTHCNTFNSAKTICNLIRYKVTRYDEYTPTEILEEILQHNHYKPTIGSNGENPLTIAILEFKSVEIQQLLDYCIYHCIHDGQPGFMSIVVDALPELTRHYPKILDKLMKQCTYVKIPPIIWKLKPEKYDSIHENLWGDKFDGSVFMTNSKKYFLNTLFDKWETIPRHSATYCFIPLPGLCTYPEINNPCHWLTIFLNTLIPRHPSTFVKLTRLRPFEAFKYSSFEAIVKFKWHAFARWRFFQLFFLYLVHFGLFISAVNTNRRQLVIASMILGAILILTWIRRSIIHYVNGIRFFTVFATYIELAAFILPVITGSLKHGDNVAPPELQSLSVLSLWIFVAAQLRVFKGIGVIIAVVAHISRKILWFLLLLAFILLAFANSLMILSKDSKVPNTFTSFDSSLKNVWSMVLCDYESLDPWTDNRLVDIYKIVFSFSTTIILMNILIARLSGTYEETINYARTVWVIKRAEIIIDIELSWMIPSERQNRNYFPWSIIYEAFTEDVDEWSKRFDAQIPCEMNDEVKDVIAKIRDEIDEMKDEITKFKNELKQSLSAEFQKFYTKVVEQEIK